MAGKTIGIMSTGGSTDYLLNAMLEASNTDPKSVKRVVTGFSASAYAFLQRGQVDAFFSFYPMRIALETAGAPLYYLNSDDVAPMPPEGVLASTAALQTAEGRKYVVGFLRACARGMRFMNEPANLEEVISLMAKYNPVEAQDRALARKKFEAALVLTRNPEGVPFMHCDEKIWERGIGIMEKIGLIKPGAKPLSAYYTNEFIRSI